MANEVISYSIAKSRGLTHYFTGKPCKHGHIALRLVSAHRCLECHNADVAKWRSKNRAKENATTRRWRERNPKALKEWATKNRQKLKAYSQKWRDNNPDKAVKAPQKWRRNNKDKVRALTRNRQARKRAAHGKHTAADITEILRLQKYRCAAPHCRKKLSDKYDVDHIIPLINGGSNDRKNIQIMCPSCNRCKGAKDPISFAREIGLLI